MKILELRELTNTYGKINKGLRKEIYYDGINNNLILFDPIDKECNTNSIYNGITDKPYLHLMKELNTNNNLVVCWSQIEGTTSDYIIYYGLNVDDLVDKTYKEIINILSKRRKPCDFSCKYTKVINGEVIKLDKETIDLD